MGGSGGTVKSPFMKYEHHDRMVWVRRGLKGRHREHCLCYDCENFKPDSRVANCHIANELFKLCVREDLVTPVWECPLFKPKEE